MPTSKKYGKYRGWQRSSTLAISGRFESKPLIVNCLKHTSVFMADQLPDNARRSVSNGISEMEGKSMFRVLAAINLVLVLALGYALFSMKGTLADRIATVESTTQQAQTKTQKKMTDLVSDVELINKRVGVTSTELNHAREVAQTLRRQQEQAAKELASQLATKANSSDVDGLRQESTTKITALQQDSAAVSGEVTGIKKDLIAAREEFGRQLVD